VAHPIDAFLAQKHKDHGILPQPQADARTRVRRASVDLLGLPPSAEAVEAFSRDPSDRAYNQLINRLLASPQYGERWARYWLDIARYADTKGYVFEEERRYPYSYTYRDYVIHAFNQDLPYDRFLIEQLAADQLNLGADQRPLAALGFLTLGRRFLNNIHDIIDDRLDVVFRGTMGITIGCARCHDHKFDPVPSKDYYSLYGVFASSSEPAEKPLLGQSALPPAYPQYVEERKKRTEELESFRTKKTAEAIDEVRRRTGDYLLTASQARALADGSKAEALARERKLDPGIANKWKDRLTHVDWTNRPPIRAWLQVAALSSNDFPASLRTLANQWLTQTNSSPFEQALAKALPEAATNTLQTVALTYNQLAKESDGAWKTASKPTDGSTAIQSLPKPEQEALRSLLYAADSPANVPAGEVPRLFDVPTAQKSRALQRKVEELDATHEGAPPRAMVLVENPKPHDPRVFIRGNPGNQGDAVPRQFLGFLSEGPQKPFEKGGGRLELAHSIASPQNPLTARVFVNRVWLYHFGAPLVRTPSDFGLRSDPPIQPELLDFLAAAFIESGWSIKALHRLIMTSDAYQRRSDEDAGSAALDPANNSFWRMNRRRLDFESSRDTLLHVAGRLSSRVGGHAEDIASSPQARRRTVYGFIDRQNLPGMYRTFDFANPDASSSQRFSTTVPQQALFLLNNPFVVEQARSLIARPEVVGAVSTDQKLHALYRLAYQRPPSSRELETTRSFLNGGRPPSASSAVPPSPQAWQELAQAVLSSNELFFVD